MLQETNADANEPWRKALQETVSRLPRDFATRAASALALNAEVRAKLAEALTPSLNAYLQTQPQRDYSEKRELATWVNQQLRDLGMAIQCPKTHAPAILVVDVDGSPGASGRFRFESHASDGRTVRTCTSHMVPTLTLVDDFQRQQARLSNRVARLNRGNPPQSGQSR